MSVSCDILWMVGRSFSEIWYREPDNWWLSFAHGVYIQTESPWRLVGEGQIKLTSMDHGHWFGLPAPVDAEERLRVALSNLQIRTAQVRADTMDIILEFESGDRLEILPLSFGYECWDIGTPDGVRLIAQGGKVTASL